MFPSWVDFLIIAPLPCLNTSTGILILYRISVQKTRKKPVYGAKTAYMKKGLRCYWTWGIFFLTWIGGFGLMMFLCIRTLTKTGFGGGANPWTMGSGVLVLIFCLNVEARF